MNSHQPGSLDPNASQKNKSITLKCTKYVLPAGSIVSSQIKDYEVVANARYSLGI
jgi:hypothetical protein